VVVLRLKQNASGFYPNHNPAPDCDSLPFENLEHDLRSAYKYSVGLVNE